MNLIKITDLVTKFDISSRSLRYYEQVGLIQSVRIPFDKFRYYDTAAIERLKQIMVLRKMLIPIKDIIRIYESETMDTVVQTFVSRIQSIDDEVNALGELRKIVNEFLQVMLQKGVTKISALPILYEGMEKQLEQLEQRKPTDYEELSAISGKLTAPVQPVIMQLPAMRVLSSCLKENPQTSDTEGFWRWVQANNVPMGMPGTHRQFEYQDTARDVTIIQIPEDFANTSPYADCTFAGGLFAAAHMYLDEDLGQRFRALIAAFDDNKYYEIDYNHDGTLRHQALVENLISPDGQRVLISIMVPVKKRLADPALFHKPEEVPPAKISIADIEKQNPILWEADVALNKLIPINNPHYKVLDTGEVEYTGWISTRVLSTGVEVKLPFRIDLEFKLDEKSERFGQGSAEGSIRIFHGNHNKDHGYVFGINMNNNADPRLSREAICFHQPVFRDYFYYPKRGGINQGYNKLTWIVGQKHLACIINDEIRYCGTNFPYMGMDLTMEAAKPIIIGSDGQGMKYFRSIRVSQLATQPKNKLIKEGVLTMATRQSNNIITNIHRLVTDEYGENYWFNGCAAYVLECLGETDYDYWFFAGISGDIFTQFYPHSHSYSGDALSSIRIYEGDTAFVEGLFTKCGYASTYVLGRDLAKNKEMYRQTLISYIDKGVPVIAWGDAPVAICGVFVGYEEHGKTLLYITGNKNEPERVSFENAIGYSTDSGGNGERGGWVFVGEKTHSPNLANLYREAIQALPSLLTHKTDTFSYGADAFREWANAIESGWFENIKPEDFDGWGMYTNFICVLATNGSCCHNFLKRAQELNPDMTYLDDISKLYKKTADMWNNQNSEDLEALGGGFNVTLEALQDTAKRSMIAAKLKELAGVTDEIVRKITNA